MDTVRDEGACVVPGKVLARLYRPADFRFRVKGTLCNYEEALLPRENVLESNAVAAFGAGGVDQAGKLTAEREGPAVEILPALFVVGVGEDHDEPFPPVVLQTDSVRGRLRSDIEVYYSGQT